MKEYIQKITPKLRCLGWIFGIRTLLVKLSERLDKQRTQPTIANDVSQHKAITGAEIKYARPELVPGQPEYIQQYGGTMPRVYKGHDLRG
jgi:hypothetical protein